MLYRIKGIHIGIAIEKYSRFVAKIISLYTGKVYLELSRYNISWLIIPERKSVLDKRSWQKRQNRDFIFSTSYIATKTCGIIRIGPIEDGNQLRQLM